MTFLNKNLHAQRFINNVKPDFNVNNFIVNVK